MFDAYGLKFRINHKKLIIFEAGTRYHIVHFLGLSLISILDFNVQKNIVQFQLFFSIFIFSDSLHLLVLTGHKWFGSVIQVGSIAVITG